jgi:hypothetical protein
MKVERTDSLERTSSMNETYLLNNKFYLPKSSEAQFCNEEIEASSVLSETVLNEKKRRLNALSSSKKREMIKDGTIIEGHIAKVGEFEGYRDGGFSLTKTMFDTMISNFEREANPIPIYRGHADLVPTSSGEEPKAAGWILGLRRFGDDLWATIQLTDSMASEIKSGEYRFTSIYARMNETDRKTGAKIGPRLVSLAITNQPFIDGLEELSLSGYGLKSSLNSANSDLNNGDLNNGDMKNEKETKELIMSKKEEEKLMEVDDLLDIEIDDTDDAPLSDMKTDEKPVSEKKEEEEEVALEDDPMSDDLKAQLESLREMASKKLEQEVDLPALMAMLKDMLSAMSVASDDKEADKEEAAMSEEKVSEEKVEDNQEEEKEEKPEDIAASTLALALSTIRTELKEEKLKNKELLSKLEVYEEEKVSAWATEQVKLGLFHEAKKADWATLYKTNKELALSLLNDKEPEIILSRISNASSDESSRKENATFSDHEKRILEGARIKK